MPAIKQLEADVSLRHDPIGGVWRWLCKCGAGYGVESSEKVAPPLWTDYYTANTGRIGHASTHR